MTWTKSLLFKVLPFVPASLPTLLFCRITELTIYVEGNDIVEYEMWEEMVSNRYKLIDMANDIKIIGKFWVPIRYDCPKKQFLCLPSLYSVYIIFTVCVVSKSLKDYLFFRDSLRKLW